jgi:type III secretion protein N (ATPase)
MTTRPAASNIGYLEAALDTAGARLTPVELRGRVVDAIGTIVRARGLAARIGDLCELVGPTSHSRMLAEVVGVASEMTLLVPFGDLDGISGQTEVAHLGRVQTVKVGPDLLGRVLDGFGAPIDGCGPLDTTLEYPLRARSPDPLSRRRVLSALATGVRAIDGLLTCGVGQRTGIFAPAGAGKSSLLAMIARGAAADVTVVGLIGERGREVGDFLACVAVPALQSRLVCIAATSDRPAVERVKAANVATAIAEYFRDQGLSVLLLIDSLTRYARALRELGLAAGEPPTRRGFPPSVFTALPRLLERAGQSNRGAITAFYSVLTDDEPAGDPIAEELRAILDGHIVLSGALAASNHYPAIDVAASRSRLMNTVATAEHCTAAGTARELLEKHKSLETLIALGEYKTGMDPQADRAIRCRPALDAFLRQRADESMSGTDTLRQLQGALSR